MTTTETSLRVILLLAIAVCGCSKAAKPPAKLPESPKVGERWWFSNGDPFETIQTNTVIAISNGYVLATNQTGFRTSMPINYYEIGFHKIKP